MFVELKIKLENGHVGPLPKKPKNKKNRISRNGFSSFCIVNFTCLQISNDINCQDKKKNDQKDHDNDQLQCHY
jgi:hypothetical protein